jgi:hypothetical protein
MSKTIVGYEIKKSGENYEAIIKTVDGNLSFVASEELLVKALVEDFSFDANEIGLGLSEMERTGRQSAVFGVMNRGFVFTK